MHASSLPQEEGSNGEQTESENGTFWTLCPYCYYLHQYDVVYNDFCLRCQTCKKPFHGVAVAPPPPAAMVERKDQYYCGVGCFPLKYNLGTSLDDKKGENVGIRDSFLGEKKGNNEGFKTNLENFVLISDDDSDGVNGSGEKGGDIVKNEDETGPELQRSLGTEGKDDEMKRMRKRKINVKAVAKNTKKLMGRGIRYTGTEPSGNGDAELKEEVGESQPENTGRNESEKEESFEDDLEFFLGEDDIYVSLKSI